MIDQQNDSAPDKRWRQQFHAFVVALENASETAGDQTALAIIEGLHQALHWGEPALKQLASIIESWRRSKEARQFGKMHRHRFQPLQTSDPDNN